MKQYKRTRFCKETGWGNRFQNKTVYDEGKFQFSRPFKYSLHPDTNVRLHPNLPPASSCTHLFFKSYAVRLDGFLYDAFNLLAAFLEGPDRSFEAFKNIWISRQFSLVHVMCNERLLRDRAMLALFQLLFTFLYEDVSAKFSGISLSAYDLHIGVVFSLFMLYNTQPTRFPKSLIPLDVNQFDLVLKIYAGFCNENITDGIYALGTLIKDKCFMHVCFIDHRPYFYLQSKLEAGGHIPGLSSSKKSSSLTSSVRDPGLDPTLTRIEILNEQLDEIEVSLKSSRLDSFCESGNLNDIVDLEKQYKLNKLNIVSDFSSFGLNEPIVSTFTDRDFLNWVSSQEHITREESIVFTYLDTVFSEHSSKKELAMETMQKPSAPNNSNSPQQNEVQLTEVSTEVDPVQLSLDQNSGDLAFFDPNDSNLGQPNSVTDGLNIFSSFFNQPSVDFNSAEFTKALDSLLTESHNQTGTATLQPSEQLGVYSPDHVPEKTSEHLLEQLSGFVPEQAAEYVPRLISQHIPNQMPEPGPGPGPEPGPEQSSDYTPRLISEHITNQASDSGSEQTTDYLPRLISQHLLDQMPETVPEQATEYLPRFISQQLLAQTTETVPEQPSDYTPKLFSQHLLDQMPKIMPEQSSDYIPRFIPNLTPEQESDFTTDQSTEQASEQIPKQSPEQIPELDLADTDNPFSPFFDTK